jgi:hypothetical protein
MLSDAEAQSGAALATYGRSTWGGIAMQSSTLNVLTQFRHGDGAADQHDTQHHPTQCPRVGACLVFGHNEIV